MRTKYNIIPRRLYKKLLVYSKAHIIRVSCITVILILLIKYVSSALKISHFTILIPTTVSIGPKPDNITIQRSSDLGDFKRILYWNDMWYSHDWNFGYGSEPFRTHKCSEQRCTVSSRDSVYNDHGHNSGRQPINDKDLALLNWAHAILFHIPTLERFGVDTAWPIVRYGWQLWVFASKEPPTRVELDMSRFPRDAFNLTMTYRRDSDIYWGYGRVDVGRMQSMRHKFDTERSWSSHSSSLSDNKFLKLPDIIVPDDANKSDHVTSRWIVSNKTRLVAWFVSNCHSWSGRELYYKELAKHIPIDVYGECFTTNYPNPNNSCPKHSQDGTGDKTYDFGREIRSRKRCYEMLEAKYYFYLAFENSLCRDYVTEKFFETLALRLIPIVFGGSDYATFAPPDTYINVQDFPSPVHLARHLLELANDGRLYRHKLDKKASALRNRAMVIQPTYPLHVTGRAMCDLCQLLHKVPKDKTSKKMENFKSPQKSGRDRETVFKKRNLEDGKVSRYNYPDVLDWWYSGGQCKKLCLPWGLCHNVEYEPFTIPSSM